MKLEDLPLLKVPSTENTIKCYVSGHDRETALEVPRIIAYVSHITILGTFIEVLPDNSIETWKIAIPISEV